MLIVPRISNRVGEQIAHTTIEDFKALKSSELVPSDYYEVTEIGRKEGSAYVMPDFYEPEAKTRSYLFKLGRQTAIRMRSRESSRLVRNISCMR